MGISQCFESKISGNVKSCTEAKTVNKCQIALFDNDTVKSYLTERHTTVTGICCEFGVMLFIAKACLKQNHFYTKLKNSS